MRRLALLVAVGATWLFLAALPALADGGPHIVSINDGSLGINADSCAGCHRAHTAQGPLLINAASEEELCLTCHGSGGVGSTVDVMTGVQYKVALPRGSAPQDPSDPAVLLGALRNGGFDQARIGSDAGVRVSYYRSATAVSQRPFVGVGAPEDVTSSHLEMAANGIDNLNIAWGNGPFNATANPGLPYADLSCANCHNPHGNGQFRILNPTPDVSGADTTAIVIPDVPVDNPDPAESDVKNYTIIQGQLPNYYPYADDVLDAGYGPTAGDYFRRTVPWKAPADKNPITGVVAGVFTTTFVHELNGADSEVIVPPATTSVGTGDAYISGVAGLPDGLYEVTDTPTTTTFTIDLSPGVPYAGSGAVTAATFASRVGGGTTNFDAPNGQTGTGGFIEDMAQFCTSCHTRYLADGLTPVVGNPYDTSSGDAIFTYRHPTRSNRQCTECHVTHGSNAAMPGQFSSTQPYPDGTVPNVDGPDPDTLPDWVHGNSRLLKLDNRGTCQACHDPTETTIAGEIAPTGGTLPAFP